MRKAKLIAQQKRKPVKQHTRAERLALRRKKRKEGPSAVRRAEARKAKRDAYATRQVARIQGPTEDEQAAWVNPVMTEEQKAAATEATVEMIQVLEAAREKP